MIQVDVISVSFTYSETGAGYQISIRSCDDNLHSNKIAEFICEGIGNGGGHKKKAGGRIQKEYFKKIWRKTDLRGVRNASLSVYRWH